MRIKTDFQLVALTASLALACGVSLAQSSPQDHIVLALETGGRTLYVNADDPGDWRTEPRLRAGSPGAYGPANLRALAGRTARSFQVDPRLVDAVIQVESGYNPRARSPKGALGLMQLEPGTASRYGVNDPFDPSSNVRGGVGYLGDLLKRFDGDVPLSLAAYNAGEEAVQRAGGIPPFAETRNYVRKVTALFPGAVGAIHESPSPRTAAAADIGAIHESPLRDNAVSRAPIYRYVDAQGVIHFVQ